MLRRIKNLFWPPGLPGTLQAAAMIAAEQRVAELQRSCGSDRLERFGFRVYSQNDEDGIIAEIFHRIGVSNRRFVEIGCGDGRENNTAFLLHQGWSGCWIEGSKKNALTISRLFTRELTSGALAMKCAFVSAANINEVLRERRCEGGIDFLSIDIDGNDYYVVDAINVVQPRVICAEYNAKFPPPVDWVMPRNDRHVWDGSDWFGASLSAFVRLAETKGYVLVGCSLAGTNAFFVQSNLREKFCGPFTADNFYQPARYYLSMGFPFGHGARS